MHYRQGYLCLDAERSVRVRVGGGKAVITIKSKSEGDARDEFEYSIPVEDGTQILKRMCVKPIIEKTRYKIHHDDLTWEIDEFSSENEGLVIAEVETPERDIPRPSWVGEEVTSDSRYANVNLVKQPYSQWRQPVEK